MYVVDPYKTFDTSLRNARNVLSLEWLYDGLKQFLGTFLLLALVVLLYPLVLLFGFWLQTKRKKFRKVMRTPFNGFYNSNHYLHLKVSLKQFKQFNPTLKKVAASNLKKTPFLLRYTVGQMQKMSSTLVTYSEWLESHLNCLNTEQFKSESKEFKLLTEKELWRKRNKAYQYWM